MPSTNDIEVATYADDTAFIATSFNRNYISLHLQEQFNIVDKRLKH